MKKLGCVIVSAMTLAACGGGSSSTLDPTGNWNTTLTWGTGTCGETGTKTDTTTVTRGAGGYLISDTDPNINLTATITCTPSQCVLSGAETESVTAPDGSVGTGELSVNLTLSESGVIAGSGTFNLTFSSGSCTQAFTVAGTKQ